MTMVLPVDSNAYGSGGRVSEAAIVKASSFSSMRHRRFKVAAEVAWRRTSSNANVARDGAGEKLWYDATGHMKN